MKLQNQTVLITGANRGIGQALMQEALQQGAKKVYTSTRLPLSSPDPSVVPLMLDITDPAELPRAAEEIASLDMLINNAGIESRPAYLAAKSVKCMQYSPVRS